MFHFLSSIAFRLHFIHLQTMRPREKAVWWRRNQWNQSGSELKLCQQWTRRGNRIFGRDSPQSSNDDDAMSEGEERDEQANPTPILTPIPIPPTCLEVGVIDAFAAHLQNVIPPRHSNLRLIQGPNCGESDVDRRPYHRRLNKQASNISIRLIFIPSSLLKIGLYAFHQSQLQYLIFARNAQISFIDRGAFSTTERLHSVLFPPPIDTLGDSIFDHSSLKFVSFPSTIRLKVFPRNSFSWCDLSSIEIPASVERIGDAAFSRAKLESIAFPSNSKL